MKTKRGMKVFLIETRVVSSNYENYEQDIYYYDTKKRVVYKQCGLVFNDRTIEYVTKQSQRSMQAVVNKYEDDYMKFKHLWTECDLQITELGEL